MVNVFRLDYWNRGVGTMQIERITVHGFRNIDTTTMFFNKIQSLISLNSFGKSNLLTAIDFGISFISSDNKKTMMRWIPGVPLNRKLAQEDFKFELEMTTDTDSALGRVWITYGFQFRWIKSDKTGGSIISEWLKVKKDGKGQKYAQYILRAGDKAKYKKVDSGRCDYSINIEQDELVINKLNAYDNLFFIDIVKKINKLSAHIERHLDAEPAYHPAPFVRTDWEDLQIDNLENLPRAIYHLKKDPQTSHKYDLLISSYQQLFPQIEKIEVVKTTLEGEIEHNIPEGLPFKVTNEVFALFVTDKTLNQPINFENMSDGAKRILLLLTCIILSDHNQLSLVAIEEPENCIHPSLLQHLLEIIDQMTETCRVLVTSHSPYLIQYLDLSSIYVGLPSNNGVARFFTIRSSSKKALEKDAVEARESTGDYIFDLMSGSEEDIKELIKYLECD
jgi:predicted ATP-dependent endonuclease of OLD family